MKGYEVARPHKKNWDQEAKSAPNGVRHPADEVGHLSYSIVIPSMYYVYILKLRDKTYYIGFSSNLKHRLQEHRLGLVGQTKHLLPCAIVFYAAFYSKKKALDFERYLKTNSGFAFRNKRLI